MMGATLVLPATIEAGRRCAMIRDEGITVIAQTPTFYIGLADTSVRTRHGLPPSSAA